MGDHSRHSAPLHVIFFAHNFPPINTSGSQRPLRLWKYLPGSGVVAHVICSSQDGVIPEYENVHYVPKPGPHSLGLRLQSALAYLAHRIIPHNERIPWIPHALAAAEEIRARYPIHAVLSTFPPLAPHLAAMRFAARHNLPWIADFRDNLVGNPFRQREKGLAHERAFERRIFERASLLVTVTPAIIAEWLERAPEIESKTRLLWNGFDPAEEFPRAPLVQRSRRILAHVGTIYGHRHPQLLLASLERLITAGRLDPATIQVQLTGTVREPAAVRPIASFELLQRLGCLDVTALVPREEANRRMAECDYLLIIDLNELNVGHAAPAKMFDYVRAGRPVLGLVPQNSIVEDVLSRSGIPCAFVYPEDSPERQDAKIFGFLSQPPREVQANSWFTDTFDGAHQAATLAQWIRDL